MVHWKKKSLVCMPTLRGCRRGRALSLKGDYTEAEADLAKAAELDSQCAADVAREQVGWGRAWGACGPGVLTPLSKC